jgi:hypothetical protein
MKISCHHHMLIHGRAGKLSAEKLAVFFNFLPHNIHDLCFVSLTLLAPFRTLKAAMLAVQIAAD